MASEDEINAAATQAPEPRKRKPWDDDPDIARWKMEKFDPSWNKGGMLEVSSFSTGFRQCKEKYLQEAWPIVQGALRDFGVTCELNLVEECITVSTTRKTRDPYIIVKARDLIVLLARGVPAPQAIKILDDGMSCDIIKISDIIRNKETKRLQERFVRRRRRILGPNLSTRKAIEILTGCYILVQGGTVAAMGSSNGRGLKQVRRIVEDCMKNIKHPMYHIKELLIKREHAKNPALENESWDRFLPNCTGTNSKNTPFPPPQQPSQIDLELECYEDFLRAENKSAKKRQEKLDKQSERVDENKRKREAAFVPPKENNAGPSDSAIPTNGSDEDPDMAIPLKKKTKGFRNSKAQESRPRKYQSF